MFSCILEMAAHFQKVTETGPSLKQVLLCYIELYTCICFILLLLINLYTGMIKWTLDTRKPVFFWICKGADQLAHPHSLTRAFIIHSKPCLKDTDLDMAAHAMRASFVNNLTSYFLYASVSARKNAKYFKLMSGK